MKNSFLTVCLLCCLLVQAQEKELIVTDSSVYYSRELSKLYKAAYDSLRKSAAYTTLVQQYQRYRNNSDDYTSFNLFTTYYGADFKTLNASVAQNGFAPVTNNSIGFGFGISNKKKRRMFELVFASGSLNKTYKKGDTAIKSSFATLLQFEWGYAFVSSKAVNLYPYIGFGLRNTILHYDVDRQVNPAYTGITNLIVANPSVMANSFKVGYHAGIGLDVLLTNKERPGGVMLFLKGGTNRPFGKERVKASGEKLDPKINYGQWQVTAGVRFFGR